MNKTELLESGKAHGTGKRRRAKLISADVWGSSAFYPAEVLERDAELAFAPGTRMFENHLTESESWERPEGDVAKLIGKLVSHGVFEADNPEGPGVYADVEFYDSYVDRINEVGDDVGLSIAGQADYVEGEQQGRYGKIITRLYPIRSVDVVVAAGAGGKLVSILESARLISGRTHITTETEGEQSMAELTKEDFADGIAQIKEALDGLSEGLVTKLKESLVAEAPVETHTNAETVEEAPAGEGTEVEAGTEVPAPEAQQAPEVDLVAIARAFGEAGLPSAALPAVVRAVQSGDTIEDAIKAQTELREAFRAYDAPGSLSFQESDRGQENVSGTLREQILAKLKN